MSKSATPKLPVVDLSTFCKSSFTLTFAVEVIGIDVWHDSNEGWLDLGPVAQGVKLQYQLYPGQNFDVDIVIWPHVAKVFCGVNYDWVRTWQFLERRWVTFSIRHAFPVRVVDLCNFTATVTPNVGIGTLSANSKSENKSTEVYLPPLAFGQRRQFATVQEKDVTLENYIKELIWSLIIVYIPSSYLDGVFDTPYPVSDSRHQDAVLYYVREAILNQTKTEEPEPELEEQQHSKAKRDSKTTKDKKKVEKEKIKFEIKLSGDTIISGTGRITPFEVVGDRSQDLGEVIVLISSTNLPAHDDMPIVFVNVGILSDIPIKHFNMHRFTHLYTRWIISEEEHSSEHQSICMKYSQTEVNFNDHHSIPIPYTVVSDIMATFLDDPFQIELRGIRTPPPLTTKPKFFGYEKRDHDFGTYVPDQLPNQEVDVLIAQTKIDATALSKINAFIREEFPLYPPEVSVVNLEREGICTNDINAVRATVKPELVIQPGVILEAQMTLEVSMGLVGCRPQNVPQSFSRLYCLISHPDAIMTILRLISEINEFVVLNESREGLLTGFALDTGATVFLYVEGLKDSHILRVWGMTEDFYPDVKPVFSTSAKYRCRLYPELLLAAMPFNILKMFVPLSVLLGITPIYARPALPLPTRAAVLKIGRLVTSKFSTTPCRYAMPTARELKSFRLELCVAPRPPPFRISNIPQVGTTYHMGNAHAVVERLDNKQWWSRLTAQGTPNDLTFCHSWRLFPCTPCLLRNE